MCGASFTKLTIHRLPHMSTLILLDATKTRRSTSGGVAMRAGHFIKHWSVTQTTVALSSGEVELVGICEGSSISLGLLAVAKDLDIELALEVKTDATAAICQQPISGYKSASNQGRSS